MSKTAILEHVARERAAGRRPVPGFAAAFCFAVTKALVEPAPLSYSELASDTLRAPHPPAYCPLCACPAVSALRDERGRWTWNCAGGCNP